jgi:hypothetical protein
MYAASGTLVLVFPTADGLVVAADSRTRFREKLYDVREKLHRAHTHAPIVFAITGSGDFPDELPARADPEWWLRHCTYAFRGKDIIQAYLMRHPDFIVSSVSLETIAQELSGAYSAFLARFPTLAAQNVGHGICRLVLCQVNPIGGAMLFGSIELVIDVNGIATPANPRFVPHLRTDFKTLERIGAAAYVDEHVLNGQGSRFIAAEDLAILEANGLVQDLKGHEAARIARSIIAAAEKTSETIPLPSGNGIGGPISCLLVTATSVMPI